MQDIEKQDIIKTWKYKDSSRYWWKIDLYKLCEEEHPFHEGEIDFIWGYDIFRDEKEFIYREIRGQYDEIPHLTDILCDFSNYINCTIIGFSKHGK